MNSPEKLDISKFLPHRKPFLLVDKVLSISDEHVTTSFYISEESIFIENEKFIEVGLLENAAQTCSSIVGKSYFEDDDYEGAGAKLIGFISAVKKVQFFCCPNVGSEITTKAKLKSRFDGDAYSISTLECVIYSEDVVLLTCELNLFIQEVENEKK